MTESLVSRADTAFKPRERVHSPLFDILAKAEDVKHGAKLLADYIANGNSFIADARNENGFTEAMCVAHYAGTDGLVMMGLYGGDFQLSVKCRDRRTLMEMVGHEYGQEGLRILHEFGIEPIRRGIAKQMADALLPLKID